MDHGAATWQEAAGSSLRLDGRVAIVTGAANGIGLEIARMLGGRGAAVCLCDRDQGALAEAQRTLADADVDAVACPTDITAYAEVENAVATTRERWARVDILVNCAGIGGTTAPVWELDIDDWTSVIDVNLNGAFYFSRAVAPTMIEQQYGRIVNIASIAGKEGNPTSSHYSASKAGLIALTKCLGKELATAGVHVHAIAPAVIRTGILDRPGVDPGFLDSLTAKIPMQRFGTTDEVARLVGFLVSDELTFSTGAVFDLSGGRATY